MCHQNLGVITHFQGRLELSQAASEQAIALYELGQYPRALRTAGMEEGVSARSVASVNLWHLGRPDAALAHAEDGVALARRLGNPYDLASALYFEAFVRWYCQRHDPTAFRERLAEAIGLGEAHGYRMFLGLGRALAAASRVIDGDPGGDGRGDGRSRAGGGDGHPDRRSWHRTGPRRDAPGDGRPADRA
jgi:hypothetical protein